MSRLMRSTTIFTLLLMFFYVCASILPVPVLVNRAEAAGIDSETVIRGIAFGFFLYLLSKIGQAGESSDQVLIEERPDLNESELGLLARVINGEARGEPYDGMVAVGAVVLNRLKSPDFPNSLKEIIYQRGQFSCVSDGQIDLVPTQQAYQAARDALDGNDPSQGALYFYNPDKAKTLWWLSQREVTVRVGDHVFAK